MPKEDVFPPPFPVSASLQTLSSSIPSLHISHYPCRLCSVWCGSRQCCRLGSGHTQPTPSTTCCSLFPAAPSLVLASSAPAWDLQRLHPLHVCLQAQPWTHSLVLLFPSLGLNSPFLNSIFTEAPHLWLMRSAGSCGGLAVGPFHHTSIHFHQFRLLNKQLTSIWCIILISHWFINICSNVGRLGLRKHRTNYCRSI